MANKQALDSDPESIEMGKSNISLFFFGLYIVYDPYQKPPDFEMAVNHGVNSWIFSYKMKQESKKSL